MAETAKIDQNSAKSLIGASSADGTTPTVVYVNPTSHRVLVDLPSGSGTVSSVSVVTANGFAGTVATATTTPAITLSTTVTGLLKGNGTAISAASDGTDYLSSTTGVTVSQSVAQTLGSTGSRLLKLWATDITVTNAITGSITGNAATATALATGRTISITGDLTYTSPSFDGSGNVTAAGTLASVITAGGPTGSATVVPIITYDAKGRLTAVTSATITPAVGSITGLGTGIATFLATPSSANLATAVTDETGSGALVFGTNPTIAKPVMNARNQTAQTYSPAGAGTATLDLSLADQHYVTFPAGNITIALSNDTNNQIFLVSLTQDSTGSRTVTWFTTIKWAGGSPPTLTTTANKRDTFGFIRTGSGTYDGFIVGQNI